MKRIYLYTLIFLIVVSCKKDDINTLSLPPDLNFIGSVNSCGDFFVSQSLNSENSNIWLKISGTGRIQLSLDSDFQTFSIPNNDLTTSISLYDAPAGFLFCNDIFYEDSPNLISKWEAISGNIKIKVTNIEESDFRTYYDLTILIENVVFKNNNEERTIEKLLIEEAPVGWLPG